MLSDWHEFYGLLGTAAAALVALLFVAVSIATEVLTTDPESRRNTATYMTPVVFHYANILFLSLIVLIPTQTWESFGIVIAVASIGSFSYSLFVMLRVHRNSISDLSDRLGYGAVPMLCYAAGLVILLAHPQGRARGA